MPSTRFIHRHTHGDSDSPELRPAWPEAAILQLRLVRIQSWSDLVSRHFGTFDISSLGFAVMAALANIHICHR